MKQVIPLYPSSGLALVNTKSTPASLALEIHILLPLILNVPAADGLASVLRAKASLPDSLSERQNEPIWLLVRSGKYFCF